MTLYSGVLLSNALTFIDDALKIRISLDLREQAADSPFGLGLGPRGGWKHAGLVFSFVNPLDKLLLKNRILQKISGILCAVVIGHPLESARFGFFVGPALDRAFRRGLGQRSLRRGATGAGCTLVLSLSGLPSGSGWSLADFWSRGFLARASTPGFLIRVFSRSRFVRGDFARSKVRL
jgi:hypothetical protein